VPLFDRGSELVYDPHVLLRSWLALRDRASLSLPSETPALIEGVYGPDVVCPPGEAEALRDRWAATEAAWGKVMQHELDEAGDRWLGPPWSRGGLRELVRRARAEEEDDPDLHPAFVALTRLPDHPSVRVIVLYRTPDGGLGLDPAGSTWVKLDDTPPLPFTRRLLLRSAPVNDARAARALLAQETPEGWRESALLRHHRPLILEPDGDGGWSAVVGTRRVRLDDELGLLVGDA
jgi:CRISPR-associated endonuclease/helicase Cas3